jgi:hypothetical protein
MPAHGTAPDEVLQLVTRAGGSWWLGIATVRPTATDTTVTLADIPLLEVPRDATAWADPVDGVVQHTTGLTLPAATADTTAAAWVLFDDAAGTLPRFSRWFDEDRTVVAGTTLGLSPDVLQLEYTPPTYPYL